MKRKWTILVVVGAMLLLAGIAACWSSFWRYPVVLRPVSVTEPQSIPKGALLENPLPARDASGEVDDGLEGFLTRYDMTATVRRERGIKVVRYEFTERDSGDDKIKHYVFELPGTIKHREFAGGAYDEEP